LVAGVPLLRQFRTIVRNWRLVLIPGPVATRNCFPPPLLGFPGKLLLQFEALRCRDPALTRHHLTPGDRKQLQEDREERIRRAVERRRAGESLRKIAEA